MRESRSLERKPLQRFVALLYAMVALVIGTYAARQFVSEYLAASAIVSKSLSEARLAVKIFAEDPNAQQTLGTLLLESGDHPEAVSVFERAVNLRERDYRCWQILGTARYASGDLDGAEFAYRKSIEIAPHYSDPNYLYGKLLIETGRQQEGFEALSVAAENNFPIFPQIVDLADKYYPNDAAAIESAASPRTVEAKTYLARHFIERSLMSPTSLAFLFGNEISEPGRDQFVDLLINKENFSLAHDLWASRIVPDGPPTNDLIFDGGFEHMTGGGQGAFGWHVDQDISGVSVSRTTQGTYSGASAIHFKFSGPVSIGKNILTQLVLVRPGSHYILKFYYRSPEILSASPPIVLVTDPFGAELGRSEGLKTTENGWIEVAVKFVSNQTPAVTIGLVRPSCDTSPCPIFGELSLDGFSLVDSPSR